MFNNFSIINQVVDSSHFRENINTDFSPLSIKILQHNRIANAFTKP